MLESSLIPPTPGLVVTTQLQE